MTSDKRKRVPDLGLKKRASELGTKAQKSVSDLGAKTKRRASEIGTQIKGTTAKIIPGRKESNNNDTDDHERQLRLERERLRAGNGELSEPEKQQKLQQVAQALSDEESHVQRLRTSLETTQSELTTCQEIIHISHLMGITNDNVQTTIHALERKQQKIEAALSKFKENMDATTFDTPLKLLDQINSSNKKIEDLGNTIADLRARRKRIPIVARAFRRFFDQWRTTRAKTTTELKELKTQLKTAQAELETQAATWAKQHLNLKELAQLQTDLKGSETAINTLDKKKDETFTTIRAQIARINNTKDRIEYEIHLGEKTIAELQTHLRKIEQDQKATATEPEKPSQTQDPTELNPRSEQAQDMTPPTQDATAAEPEKPSQTQDPTELNPQEIKRARIEFHKSLNKINEIYLKHLESKKQVTQQAKNSRFFNHKENNMPLFNNMLSSICSASQHYMRILQYSANKTEDAAEYQILRTLTGALLHLNMSMEGMILRVPQSENELIDQIENAIQAMPSGNPLHDLEHPLQKFITERRALKQDNADVSPTKGSN
ncbi:MAG: hypothetical protein NXI01_06315 [Gammaproteobacteria bacterium]|nr:hypothetical protein [Gammaproteobacteria bacterium]